MVKKVILKILRYRFKTSEKTKSAHAAVTVALEAVVVSGGTVVVELSSPPTFPAGVDSGSGSGWAWSWAWSWSCPSGWSARSVTWSGSGSDSGSGATSFSDWSISGMGLPSVVALE